MIKKLLVVAVATTVIGAPAYADMPGKGWISSANVKNMLAKRGYRVTKLEADDGHWEGEARKANASYEFRCKAPAALRTVDVRLFDAFARLERVRVQAALPGGQRKATLRRQATVLRLRP